MKVAILERLNTYTTLGVRFWDAAINRPANDLHVIAQRLNADGDLVGRPVIGRSNQSGVIVFFGLHPEERVTEDHVEPNLSRFDALIEVRDLVGDYLPIVFKTGIPHKGIYRGDDLDWPDGFEDNRGVYLFSSVNRPAPEGMAIIEGDLVVGNALDDPPPARFALVKTSSTEHVFDYTVDPQNPALREVEVVSYGMADQNGRLKMPLSYPALSKPTVKKPLRAQTFGLTLQVFYDPAIQAQEPLPTRLEMKVDGSISKFPNYASILKQSQARIMCEWDAQANEFVFPDEPNMLTFELKFEQPHVLHTPFNEQNEGGNYLRIKPPKKDDG